ncbi:MAG: Asp-tRNA(Asn)/Glu-tRNA(Gln) amidotransferase subunit GatC [Candidatus Omnitrophota bacterium]
MFRPEGLLMHLDIEKVAQLARILLAPAEKEKLSKDLDAILGYVEKLQTLDTEKVDPTSHVLDMENVHRPDEARGSNAAEQALKHAPQTEGRFFKVPKIVHKG